MTKPQTGFRITSLWCFTCVDDDDEEGVVGYFDNERNSWIPLVCSDRVRLTIFREYAAQIATSTGKPIRLTRYTEREDIETYWPG